MRKPFDVVQDEGQPAPLRQPRHRALESRRG
jgi:hypothetical protein